MAFPRLTNKRSLNASPDVLPGLRPTPRLEGLTVDDGS